MSDGAEEPQTGQQPYVPPGGNTANASLALGLGQNSDQLGQGPVAESVNVMFEPMTAAVGDSCTGILSSPSAS